MNQDDNFPQTTEGTVFAPDGNKSSPKEQLGQLCSDVLGRVKDVTLLKMNLLTMDKQDCIYSV